MKQNILVSVIVPIYNVESYLKRCINSILNQTYKNLEVILVDDGSTDNSSVICDLYQKKDKRVKVIHKKNGGLSDARNYGIDVAKGECIFFVDSDDWIDLNAIELLIQIFLENNVDVVVSKQLAVENNKIKINKKNISVNILTKEEALEELLYQKSFTTSACGKLYKANIVKNNKFPVGKLFEDVMTVFYYVSNSNKIAVVNKELYFYYKRNNSITKSTFDIRKMDYVDICTELYNYVCTNIPVLEEAALSRLIWADIYILVHMNNFEEYEKEFQTVWKHIKQNRWDVIKNNKCKLKCRIVCLLTYLGPYKLKQIFNKVSC